MEAACTTFMQNFTFMLSWAPFVMESFAKEQDGGDNSINIKVRFSSEQPQQRGGEREEASGENLKGLSGRLPVHKQQLKMCIVMHKMLEYGKMCLVMERMMDFSQISVRMMDLSQISSKTFPDRSTGPGFHN